MNELMNEGMGWTDRQTNEYDLSDAVTETVAGALYFHAYNAHLPYP